MTPRHRRSLEQPAGGVQRCDGCSLAGQRTTRAEPLEVLERTLHTIPPAATAEMMGTVIVSIAAATATAATALLGTRLVLLAGCGCDPWPW